MQKQSLGVRVMRFIYLTLLLMASLYSAEFGDISLVVIKDGRPLMNQNFVIYKVLKNDSKTTLDKTTPINAKTDEDGYFYSKMATGDYQIQLISRDNGIAQAFVRKNVAVKSGEESQIIVSLKADNGLAFIDAEAPTETNAPSVVQLAKVQTGSLLLTLFSSQDKKKIAKATIYVKGLNAEASSDKNGFVDLTLPEGEQTLSIIHSDFSAQTIKVTIIAKEAISKTLELSPVAMELDEFVVLAPHIEGSVAAVIAEQKNNDAVGDVLGSEQFGKSGDSSVASALKRVSGVTIVGGKYVYVRGLGDRYSTVMLNGLHIPSPEPTKRVVPLDIFPTSVVESITIQKSYTGDIPASFGGGTVLIKSKDIPKDDDGYVKLGLELIANDSTGKSVTTNSDNSKPLPASVTNAGHNFSQLAKQTQNVVEYRTLNHAKTTLQPGVKFELSGAKSFVLSDNFTLGAAATFSYKNSADGYDIVNDKYVLSNGATTPYHAANIQTQETTLSEQTAGTLNVGMEYYKKNKIKYSYFTTSNNDDRTVQSKINYGAGEDVRDKTYYEYSTKNVTTNQLIGSNEIAFSNSTDGYFDNLKIDWAWENAQATRDEPGTLEYNYLSNATTPEYWDKNGNYYYYFKLNDNVSNYRVDFTLPFLFNDNENYVKAGIFIYNKSRDFDSRTYSLFANNATNLNGKMDTVYKNNASSFEFRPSYSPTDSYRATQDVSAFYLKELLSVTHDVDVIASVRMEESTQQLTDAEATYAPLKTTDFFPTLGLTYRFDNDAMQLRLAYAQSVSRPDFREFSKSAYLDPITENDVFGNPDLKSTYINHLDLKYEWYLSDDEIFSFALFSKYFTDPIEKVMKPNNTQGGVYKVTYQNAESASSYGAEMDYRRKFGFISDSLENLLFATNVAFIQSNIVLNKDPNNDYTSQLTTKTRAMQGQSPYVLNFTLGYDNADKGDSALFLFNQIGESVSSLGTNGNKDVYQQPFAKLDFVTKWKISEKEKGDFFGYALRLKIENLLDSAQEFTQGDLVSSSVKPGRYYSLKLDVKY